MLLLTDKKCNFVFAINEKSAINHLCVYSVDFCELLAEHVAICGCFWSAEITHVTF